LFISACAQPVPDSVRVPLFSGIPTKSITVGVTDHRPFVLNEKEDPWFEGILRDGFGIPHSFQRPDSFGGGIPLSQMLSQLLRESLGNAGSQVRIVTLPVGADINQSVSDVATVGSTGLLLVIRDSRINMFYRASYRYDHEILVVGPNREILAQKRFSLPKEKVSLAGGYSYWGLGQEQYGKTFTKILNDPEIKKALSTGQN
jgi:hypothetical protein